MQDALRGLISCSFQPLGRRGGVLRAGVWWIVTVCHRCSGEGISNATAVIKRSAEGERRMAEPVTNRTVGAAGLPGVGHLEWQRRASCRGVPTEFFFSDEAAAAVRVRNDEQAKALCRLCPVLTACAVYALTADEPYGVWGAMTARERALIRRQRHLIRRQRHPPKVS